MEETAPTKSTTSARLGRPALSVLTATLLTMIITFFISNLSFFTSVALGSFAGFCVAAWNWFRMGRRRKALVHVLLGLGVYVVLQVGYALLASLLVQAFSPSPPVETEINIPGVTLPGARMISNPQLSIMIPIMLMAYCVASGALVLLYLYRATAHDVPKTKSLDDNSELKRLLPLLGVAAISSAAIVFVNVFVTQVRTAHIQNRIYCELLQPGMTFEEVENALNEIGPHRQAWYQDVPYPKHSEMASFYRDVSWNNYRLEVIYNLSLELGYDANDRLVWRGRSTGFSAKTIQCPWTFSQSVTAQ